MKTLDFDGAIAALGAGELVVFATETVFGLGADASQDAAVAKIYEVKGRPTFNPLIVHVGDALQAQGLVDWNDRAESLAQAFWPGPLTLVLPKKASAKISPIVSAGAKTLAIRCPQPIQARELAAAFPSGIAAPSANKSGGLSPTRQNHVFQDFAGDDRLSFLSGDRPAIGLESTVVDLSGPATLILRQGGITRSQLEAVLGPVGENEQYFEDFGDEQISSPGQLRRHYAPRIPLFLNQTHVAPGHALLAFGPEVPAADFVFNLSESGDLVEAAARLFDGLHVLSACGATAISAMPVPRTGIGLAINDRLQRGAVPAP